MDNVNGYNASFNITLVPCDIEINNKNIIKILSDLSERYFQLLNSSKACSFYEIDDLLVKIQNGYEADKKNLPEMHEICESSYQKEKHAVEILKSYQALIDENPALQWFPWNGRIIDYVTLRRNLAEEIVVKEVRTKVFEHLGELFAGALLSEDDQAAIYRASLRFLDALTLCLYSDKVFAARASVEELGNMFGMNMGGIPVLTDFCDGACLRMDLLPLLEKGYRALFHHNDRLEADEISYLRLLKGAFAEIAAVVGQHYGTLDYAQEQGIHVPECFFSYDLID